MTTIGKLILTSTILAIICSGCATVPKVPVVFTSDPSGMPLYFKTTASGAASISSTGIHSDSKLMGVTPYTFNNPDFLDMMKMQAFVGWPDGSYSESVVTYTGAPSFHFKQRPMYMKSSQ